MFAFNLQNTIIAAVAAFFLGGAMVGIPVWYYTADYYQTKIEVIAESSKAKVAEEVLRLTKEKFALETQLKDKSSGIQKNYEKTVAELANTRGKLRSLQLLDPNTDAGAAANVGGKGGASGTGEANPGQGLLSKQTSGNLWDFAGEADDVLEQLRACKNWKSEVEGAVKTYGEKVKQVPKK